MIPEGKIQKGSTCGTAVGAKQGRTKGNNRKPNMQNRKKRTGNQAGQKGKAEETKGTEEHRIAAVRQKTGRGQKGRTEAE